ncbi:jg9524 [Pararge aegeria aegeria]|uniref:Jg9524 protein n=1 Tax=Pararge aegeria aegeria TaxID=348720 RepID=A0A8S4RKA2_9NEOP|nr:jg9524 [Pararge aegeria aegeria]
MRFAVFILACVLAVANAQQNSGRYVPEKQYNNQYNRYNNNQYNRYNNNQYNPQNNRYNPYGNYNRNQNYNGYKPFVTSTPFPRPSVTVTPAPSVVPKVTPVPVVTPFVPVVPAVTPTPFVPAVAAVNAARVAADSRAAETVKYGNEINPDGAYNYFYETNNGIAVQAQGTPRNFGGNPPVVPDGDAIPQPPAVPEQIARALAYIARTAPVSSIADRT